MRPFGVGAGQAGDAVEAGLARRAGRRSASPRRASRRAGASWRRPGRTCTARRGSRDLAAGRRRAAGAAGRGRRRRAPRPSPGARRPCRRRSRRCGGRARARGRRARAAPARSRRGRGRPCRRADAASASDAPSPAIAQARRFDVPQSTAIQSASARSSGHHDAAVDDQRLAGHHARGLGGEKQRGVDDVALDQMLLQALALEMGGEAPRASPRGRAAAGSAPSRASAR